MPSRYPTRKLSRLTLIGITLLLSAVSLGNDQSLPSKTSVCIGPDIARVDVQLFPDKRIAGVFSYAYKYIPVKKIKATTIVVLPGGPGGTLLNRSPNETYAIGAIPPGDFNLVYIDPRGSGCNESIRIPSQALKSEYLANDVATVISNLGLSNYIIYGVSYGTVLATQTTAIIESAGLPPPKAVVLEGTFGKAISTGFKDYAQIFSKEWIRIQPALDPKVVRMLQGPNLPFGFSPLAYGGLFFDDIVSGHVPGKGHILALDFEGLSTGDVSSLNRLKKKLSQYPSKVVPLPSRLFRTIGCQELFESWGHVEIQSGQLVPIEKGEICAGFSKRPYDSGRWLISTPIYYFQGPFDPATPYASARYHFSRQTKSNRHFVTVAEAAHAPLTGSLKILNCNRNVWWALDRNPSQLGTALETCRWNISLEHARGNP